MKLKLLYNPKHLQCLDSSRVLLKEIISYPLIRVTGFVFSIVELL